MAKDKKKTKKKEGKKAKESKGKGKPPKKKGNGGKKGKKDSKGIVFVGNKPPMNYVLAVVTQFHGNSDDVHIKARGRAISRAVDVAEIARNRFIEDVKVEDIHISTETIKGENNEDINVSAIDIVLKKK